MASSTVLRVKRRLEDNPQDALVLLCKRMKTESEECSPSLFVFRGSVENQEPTHVKIVAPNKATLKQITNVNDIIQKIRKERKQYSTENRYEIVNCSRGLKEETDFDLVDLQKKDEDDDAKDVDFIYDLYTPAKEDFDISMLDTLISIEHYETDLVFGSDGNGFPSSDEDSEDSNAENDRGNEYPDTEASSIDEEDMIRAVEKCNLEDDLSSDAGEEKIYDEPADLCNEDVKRYGEAYAKYKARVLSEQSGIADGNIADSRNFVHCTEIDSEGYKHDSDEGFYYGQEEDSEHFKEQYADVSDTSDVHELD